VFTQFIIKNFFSLLIICFTGFHSFGQNKVDIVELRQEIERKVVRALKDKDVVSRLVLAKIQKSVDGVKIEYVLTHENEYQKKIDSTLRTVSYKKLFKNGTKIIIVPLAFVDLRQEDLDQNITAKLTLFELNTLLKLKREKSGEVILDPIVFASFPERR